VRRGEGGSGRSLSRRRSIQPLLTGEGQGDEENRRAFSRSDEALRFPSRLDYDDDFARFILLLDDARTQVQARLLGNRSHDCAAPSGWCRCSGRPRRPDRDPFCTLFTSPVAADSGASPAASYSASIRSSGLPAAPSTGRVFASASARASPLPPRTTPRSSSGTAATTDTARPAPASARVCATAAGPTSSGRCAAPRGAAAAPQVRPTHFGLRKHPAHHIDLLGKRRPSPGCARATWVARGASCS
jgi:hypothetical protein